MTTLQAPLQSITIRVDGYNYSQRLLKLGLFSSKEEESYQKSPSLHFRENVLSAHTPPLPLAVPGIYSISPDPFH